MRARTLPRMTAQTCSQNVCLTVGALALCVSWERLGFSVQGVICNTVAQPESYGVACHSFLWCVLSQPVLRYCTYVTVHLYLVRSTRSAWGTASYTRHLPFFRLCGALPSGAVSVPCVTCDIHMCVCVCVCVRKLQPKEGGEGADAFVSSNDQSRSLNFNPRS